MFSTAEQVYGVQTTFEPSLVGYTLPLHRKDTKEFKDQEQKAAEIANAIEAQPNHKARLDLENGDEEERFAAVIRPTNEGKYVPPAKRNSVNSGKLTRSTPPPPSPGSANNKNMFNHPPPGSTANSSQPSNIPLGGPSNHPPVQHPVMAMPPSGVVVAYNTPPPFVPPPTTQPPPVAAIPVIPQIQPQHQHGSTMSQVAFAPQQPPPPNKLNLEKRERPGRQQGYQSDKAPPAPFPQTATSHQQQQQQQQQSPHTPHTPIQQQNSLEGQRSDLLTSKSDHRKIPTPRTRDEQHAELRQFSSDFKLSDQQTQETQSIPRKQQQSHQDTHTQQSMQPSHHPPVHQHQQSLPQPPQHQTSHQQQHQNVQEETIVVSKPPSGPVSIRPTTPPQVQQQTTPPMQQSHEPAVEKLTTTFKKSTLNPNAKEFNPNAKPFTPVGNNNN